MCFDSVKQAVKYCFISQSGKQQGNIFLALFAAVGLLGLLGATAVTFVKGPLSSSVNVSRLSMAETQLMVVAQMITLDSVADPDEGDCDQDGYVEPTEWKVAASASNAPINGGIIPDKISVTKTDPWGTAFGYCSWNAGAQNTVDSIAACNEDGVASEQRLIGSPTPVYPAIAIVSAGPDRVFDAECNNFIDGNADTVPDNDMVSKPDGSDDVILTYTYREAASSGGELWALKSDDATKATIGRNLNVAGGVIMGTQDGIASCGPSDINSLRYNTMTNKIQACDGLGGWDDVSGEGGIEVLSLLEDVGTSTCDYIDLDSDGISDDAGKIRYNTSINAVEVCYSSEWRSLDIKGTYAELALSPSTGTLDVTGPCSGGLCPYKFSSSGQTFTLTNTGSVPTGVLSTNKDNYIAGVDSDSFKVQSSGSTCEDGIILAPGQSCVLDVVGYRKDNGTYSGTLTVTDPNSGSVATASLSGTASGFINVSAWLQVSVGDGHTCGIKDDGSAWCWGSAGSGRLGNNETSGSYLNPVAVEDGGATWSKISAGVSHSCGIQNDGTAWCWGDNSYSRLGISSPYNQPVPVRVNDGGVTWLDISAGDRSSCGIQADGSGWCWGADNYSQIGDGATSTGHAEPYPLDDGGATWSSISVGEKYACGVQTNGSGWCWGTESYGSLGNGGTESDVLASPTALDDGGATWSEIVAVKANNTCGIKDDDSAWCWGYDNFGELGNGAAITGTQISPTEVEGGDSWATIGSGNYHGCGIKTDGSGWCWGRSTSLGSLGNGTSSGSQHSPSPLDDGGATWIQSSSWSRHSCAIKTDGTAWCWGYGLNGQLGDGDTENRLSPVQVID
ncbi:MAG: hypothetical protein CL565_06995 [Alphaproteobacteria bacterium]|nr:hypothetical protein [Alphaproteobacteria bacterium]